MKIEHNLPSVNRNNADRVSGTQKGDTEKKEVSSDVSVSKDNAVFSDDARVISKAMMQAIEVPDTREAIVQNLKSQILNGNYQIHYEELARVLSTKGILD